MSDIFSEHIRDVCHFETLHYLRAIMSSGIGGEFFYPNF